MLRREDTELFSARINTACILCSELKDVSVQVNRLFLSITASPPSFTVTETPFSVIAACEPYKTGTMRGSVNRSERFIKHPFISREVRSTTKPAFSPNVIVELFSLFMLIGTVRNTASSTYTFERREMETYAGSSLFTGTCRFICS